MSFNVTDFDTPFTHMPVRLDGAPRTASAKLQDRECIQSQIEQFLSTGGVIEQVANGVSGYQSDV